MPIVKVQVTAEDIADGRRGCVHKCPVARAVTRVLTRYAYVKVDGPTYPNEWTARIFLHGCIRHELSLPDVVAQFAISFDDEDAFRPEPFAFDLEVPDELLEGAA